MSKHTIEQLNYFIESYLNNYKEWSLLPNQLENYQNQNTKLYFVHRDGYIATKDISHIQRNQKLKLFAIIEPDLMIYNLNIYLNKHFPNIKIAEETKPTKTHNDIILRCITHGLITTTIDRVIHKNSKFICKLCSLEYNSGKTHYNYNPNLLEEDRQERKYTPFYRSFLVNVRYLNSFNCILCENNKDLVVHHLDGYNWCKEKRMKYDNVVLLCKDCHDEFHNLYGRGDNTREQFQEWAFNKANEIRSVKYDLRILEEMDFAH